MNEILKEIRALPLWAQVAGGAAALYVVLYLLKRVGEGGGVAGSVSREDAPTVKNTSPNSTALKAAFVKVANQYGTDFAQQLEKMFRWETGHFKSGQWTRCGSPGMVAVKGTTQFPWGWSSLGRFTGGKGAGYYTVFFPQTSAGPLSYIAFPDAVKSVEYTAWFIKNYRGGNVAAWGSLDPTDQAKYNGYLRSVNAQFV